MIVIMVFVVPLIITTVITILMIIKIIIYVSGANQEEKGDKKENLEIIVINNDNLFKVGKGNSFKLIKVNCGKPAAKGLITKIINLQ